MSTDWKSTFTSTFGTPASAVCARIWAEVYGDEYPAELDIASGQEMAGYL